MKRHLLWILVPFCVVVVICGHGISQAGFSFEPELRVRLERMIQREPGACVDLIEQAESVEQLRQALVERVQTTYRALKVAEAVRALKDLDLPDEMTLQELREAAEAMETDGNDR